MAENTKLIKKRRKKKKKILIYCSKGSKTYALMEKVVENRTNFCLTYLWSDVYKANFIFSVYGHHLDRIMEEGKLVGKVHHFPGAAEVCTKELSGLALNLASQESPETYKFWPRTWLYPSDRERLKAENKGKKTVYIIKPLSSSQGDGIFLSMSLSSIEQRTSGAPCVIQDYEKKPLVIEGLKWDLRVYLLITKLDPVELYLCKEGLVRFATRPYMAPSKDNLHHFTSHLTNYSINKRTEDYDHDNSKRTMSSFIEKIGMEEWEFYEELKKVSQATISALIPFLRLSSREPPSPASAFHVFGLDVLLTEKKEFKLLEINCGPSLNIDTTWSCDDPTYSPPEGAKPCKCIAGPGSHYHEESPVDAEIKTRVIIGALDCARGLTSEDYVRLDTMVLLGSRLERVYTTKALSVNKQLTSSSIRKLMKLYFDGGEKELQSLLLRVDVVMRQNRKNKYLDGVLGEFLIFLDTVKEVIGPSSADLNLFCDALGC